MRQDHEAIKKAITAGFFFNAAKLQRSGNYRTIKNKQTVHMAPQNGLAEVLHLIPLGVAAHLLGIQCITASGPGAAANHAGPGLLQRDLHQGLMLLG